MSTREPDDDLATAWDGVEINPDDLDRTTRRALRKAGAGQKVPRAKKRSRRPRWRKMTWALIVWSAFILIWAINAAATNNCATDTACQTGTAIGVGIILVVGFMGFVILSLIWFMSRPRDRR